MPQYFLEPAMPLSMAASPGCDIKTGGRHSIVKIYSISAVTFFFTFQEQHFVIESVENGVVIRVLK